ncbi:hypothetical protein FACS1894130_01670 [Spirochaetia bacterium]|nr:hypothetical protein FACS1894130_01670 [Spirochaetia bacterium]
MPGTKGCKVNGMNTVWKMKKQQPLTTQCQTGVVSVSQKTTTSNVATINNSYNHAKSHPIKYTDPDGRAAGIGISSDGYKITGVEVGSVGGGVYLKGATAITAGEIVETIGNIPARVENAIYDYFGIPNRIPLLELDGQ